MRKSRSQGQRRHRHTDFEKSLALVAESALPDLIAAAMEPPLLLLLDCVQDPHNLGACLRSANAAGVDAVIIPKDRSARLTDVARRAACGASEHTPLVAVTNLARCMDQLKKLNIWLVGTSGRGTRSLYETDLKIPLGLVMGGEGPGLRRLTSERCDFLASIPMAKGAHVDCLNVSVAAGVALFEAKRQRAMRKPDV